MGAMMGILDKSFKYTPAAQTDIRKTFKREQKRLEDEKKIAAEQLKSIIQIRRSK